MAQVRARGIIIKQSDYGEGHRMLSIFTEEYGIVKAVSYGVKKTKSRSAAASQFLSYGDFNLYRGENKDIMTLNSVDTLDAFYPISEDIKKLSLCVYLSDITYCLLGLNNPDARILHLFLNSIYALAYRAESTDKVKAVYELKLMCAGGYMPLLRGCSVCGGEEYAFDLLRGTTVCRKCAGADSIKLSTPVWRALEYICSCDDKKMLSFNASDDVIEKVGSITERYIAEQTELHFKSLDYYKAMLIM